MNTQSKLAAADKLRSQLAQFYGSDTIYRHPLNKSVLYTEGVQYFAQHAGNGAYWFLDILATEPAILKEARDFTHVTLCVADDSTGGIVVTDGDKGPGPQIVYSRTLDFTDCPPGRWEFFFENQTIMLPGER